MSGYKPNGKTFRVRYEDYPGLLIVAKPAKRGQLVNMNELAETAKTDPNKALDLFKFFAKRILTWNLLHPDLDNDDDSDEVCSLCGLEPEAPLPTTVDGMRCLDIDFVMRLIMGWVSVMTNVPAPKGMNSTSGAENSMSGEGSALTRLGSLARQTTLPAQTST